MYMCRVEFTRHKDKYGNVAFAPCIIEIPAELTPDSLGFKLLHFLSDASKKDATIEDRASTFRSILKQLNTNSSLAFLKKPLTHLTLDEMIAYREDFFSSNTKRLGNHLSIALNKFNPVMACGARLSVWGKFRGDRDTSKPREAMASGKDLFKLIKALDDPDKAHDIAKKTVNNEYDAIRSAAQSAIAAHVKIIKSIRSVPSDFAKLSRNKRDKILKDLLTTADPNNLVSGGKQRNRTHYLGEYQGQLPPQVLLSVLIILKFARPWNTDVWFALPSDALQFHHTYADIERVIKYKGKPKRLPPTRFTNRDKQTWRALKLLRQHCEAAGRLIEQHQLVRDRERLLFEYVTPGTTSIQSNSKMQIVKSFVKLRQQTLPKFCEKHNLLHFTLDSLRNLSAVKIIFDGATVSELRRILCHEDDATTQHYLDQHVTNAFMQHNMLVFIRQLEASAVELTGMEHKFTDVVSKENIRKHLYFAVGDGSSCSNPYDSPDKHQQSGDLCNGKKCHSGCKNNKTILNQDTAYHALSKRNYYRSNFFQASTNTDKFQAFDAKAILFNALLCLFIQNQHPALYKGALSKINNRLKTQEVS